MADDKDVLLELYKQSMGQGLHHQVQRAPTANLVLLLAGVTLGFITIDMKLKGSTDMYAAIFVIILCSFGAIWTAKLHELYSNYREIALGYRDELDYLIPQIDVKGIQTKADERANDAHRVLHRLRLWWLWVSLYLLITIFGLGILLFCC